MTQSENEDFDALVAKTWKEGMKTGDLKFKESKSDIGVDNGIPYEARYLPSLEEKAEEAEKDDDDDDDEEEKEDDKKESNGDKQQKTHNQGSDPDDEDFEPKPIKRTTTDAEEEKGVQDRDGDEEDVEEGHEHEDMEMDPSEDPFLPPRKNVITEIPPEYTCMLNKYSLERGHFLVVTSEFVPQYGPVRPQDLVMLHDVVQRTKIRSYAFLNGGPDAGASQEHRHFQFMDVPKIEPQVLPDAIYDANPDATTPQSHPNLPVAHFLLPIHDSSPKALQKSWDTLYKLAQETSGRTDEKMPFNFLMTKEYMMILPRKNNDWHPDIGIGGTCMVGSIPVEDQKYIKTVKEAGLIKILSHIGFPKEKE